MEIEIGPAQGASSAVPEGPAPDGTRLAARAALRGVVRALLGAGVRLDVLRNEFDSAVAHALDEEIADLGISERLMAAYHRTYPNRVRRARAELDPHRAREAFRRNVARVLQREPDLERLAGEIAGFLDRLHRLRIWSWLTRWRARDPHAFAAQGAAAEELASLERELAADDALRTLLPEAGALLAEWAGPLRLPAAARYSVADALWDLAQAGKVVRVPGPPGFETRWRLASRHLVWDPPDADGARVERLADKVRESVATAVATLPTRPDDGAHVFQRVAMGIPRLATPEARRELAVAIHGAITGVVDRYPDHPVKNVVLTYTLRHVLLALLALGGLVGTSDTDRWGGAAVVVHEGTSDTD